MAQAAPVGSGAAHPVPAVAGIGLRHPHLPQFLDNPPAIGWLEVHSENYLAAGGPRIRALEAIRRDFPLSCHGVGLSLGSHDGLDRAHLDRLRSMFDRFQPALVSEHVAWSVADGVYLNDLLPLPYTEALAVVCRNIDHAQEVFGRRLLMENPSTYVTFRHSTMPEAEFMAALARRTGCGILLDVNNIHVSAMNNGFDADAYLAAIPADAVGEIHLAGHTARTIDRDTVLIDDHGSAVSDAVWRLYAATRRAAERGAQLGAPVLLVLGLMTRLAALPLLAMTLVIQFALGAVNPAYDNVQHFYWMFLLAALILRGAGPHSVDRVLARRL